MSHSFEIPGTGERPPTRGEPLLIWGELADDALSVRSPEDLAIALDALHSIAVVSPCLVRLWSTADDQVVTVLNGRDCALYVVSGRSGLGTSVGDPTRETSFSFVDRDVGALIVPWSDCLPWRVVREALIRFAQNGDLGDQVILEGRIPSQLIVFGDFDRAAALETRPAPPDEPAGSSLARRSPHGEWAERLLASMIEVQLVEVDLAMRDAICARLAILITQHGQESLESPERAQLLATELGRVTGVVTLSATAADLQIALRRTQDAPTMPVEMPFK